MAKRVLLKDMARELGLSVGTVSRALQQSPALAPATVRRVLAHAQQVGYRPNALAAGLRRGRSRLLGVLVPHLDNNYFAQVVKGVEQAADAAGYRVLLGQSADDPQRERELLALLTDAGAAGLLVSVSSATHDDHAFQAIQAQGTPVVFFDRYPLGSQLDAVVVDDYAGAYAATAHLLAQGYRRVAHLGGPPQLSIYHRRRQGYEAALRDHGLAPDPALLLFTPSSFAGGSAAAHQLLALPAPPDAVFAASDFAAAGCLQALLAAGRRVPADVGVAGFSNELFTQLTAPPLTTVEQHGAALGQAAARRLLQRLTAEVEASVPQQLVLPPTLCPRQSSLRQTPTQPA